MGFAIKIFTLTFFPIQGVWPHIPSSTLPPCSFSPSPGLPGDTVREDALPTGLQVTTHEHGWHPWFAPISRWGMHPRLQIRPQPHSQTPITCQAPKELLKMCNLTAGAGAVAWRPPLLDMGRSRGSQKRRWGGKRTGCSHGEDWGPTTLRKHSTLLPIVSVKPGCTR